MIHVYVIRWSLENGIDLRKQNIQIFLVRNTKYKYTYLKNIRISTEILANFSTLKRLYNIINFVLNY